MSNLISLYQILLILLVATHSIHCGAKDAVKDVYIVYMGSLAEGGGYSPTSHHLNILEEVLGERLMFLKFYFLIFFFPIVII